jgi:hypothetical protein
MPETDPLSALHQAATVLLSEAPLPVVRATLRTLLADTEVVVAPMSPPPGVPFTAALTRLEKTCKASCSDVVDDRQESRLLTAFPAS